MKLNNVSKIFLFALFSLILVPIVHGTDVISGVNFIGDGGGNVTFDFNFKVSSTITWINGITRFTDFVFNVIIGPTGFDCDAGDNMTVTWITQTSLNYNISGAGEQRIYFKGFGLPDEISGGVAVIGVGDSIVVTTVGAGPVSLVWYDEINDLFDQITSYLIILGIVPLTLAGAFLIVALQSGEIAFEQIAYIMSLVIGLFVLILVWAAMIS